LAQEVDVIDEKTQAALSQIGREEKAAAADKVSPIVRHRASVAQQKVIAVARRWVSLRSTHPTGLECCNHVSFVVHFHRTGFMVVSSWSAR
jgi:hypothetical protein